jgi:hypothetical protein
MPNEKDGQEPTGDPNGYPLPPPPIESAIEQRIVALEAKSHAHDKKDSGGDLAAAVRKGEGWLIGINGLALCASIGIGIIYILQLCEMRKVTKASESAAYAACVSAKIARSTLQEIQAGGTDSHNLAAGSILQAAAVTRAEAAQIKISAPTNQLPIFRDVPGGGQVVEVPFTIVNIGKTLAIKIRSDVRAVIVDRTMDKSAEPDFKFTKLDFVNTGTLDATDRPVVLPLFVFEKGDERRIFSAAERAEILNGVNKRLFAYSRITYIDIFGVTHWNQRCMIFPSTGTDFWRIPKCSAYNRTDTNQAITQTASAPPAVATPEEVACKKPED